MIIVDSVSDIEGTNTQYDIFGVSLDDACLEGVNAHSRERLCVVDDAVLVVGRITDEISLGNDLEGLDDSAIEIGLETDRLFLIPVNR